MGFCLHLTQQDSLLIAFDWMARSEISVAGVVVLAEMVVMVAVVAVVVVVETSFVELTMHWR